MQGRLPDTMKLAGTPFQLAEPMQLPDDEVHLWQVDLETAADGYATWTQILSTDERERADRFHFDRDRQRFTATRAILRTLLAAYLAADRNAVEPGKLVFRYSAKEKPSLDGEHSGGVEFNLSHSGTMALLAFTRGRALGVDVEQVREQADRDAIARRFFSEYEQKELAALPAAERCAGFFRCWTRKEAYIKATGDGLSLPLHQFDVSLVAGDENALLATHPDAGEAARWSMREVPAREGYAAALCVHGQGWKLRC
jgi:4'-phosphopantetheinyl transferase